MNATIEKERQERHRLQTIADVCIELTFFHFLYEFFELGTTTSCLPTAFWFMRSRQITKMK